MERYITLGAIGRLCRLGLATRGNAAAPAEAIWRALERGVNYWNWCGRRDGMWEAIRELGRRRSGVCIAVQLEARSADGALREIETVCRELKTDYIDVVTYYYVESLEEWRAIVHPERGAQAALEELREQGIVRCVGLTTHQRRLAARVVQEGHLDLVMVRYNAAHRGAERDLFPVTRRLGLPVVAFTVLRWRHLIEPLAAVPEVHPLDAVECYRYVLSNPDVAVALMAPGSAEELAQNLTLLDDWRPVAQEERARIEAYGRLVYRHRRYFP